MANTLLCTTLITCFLSLGFLSASAVSTGILTSSPIAPKGAKNKTKGTSDVSKKRRHLAVARLASDASRRTDKFFSFDENATAELLFLRSINCKLNDVDSIKNKFKALDDTIPFPSVFFSISQDINNLTQDLQKTRDVASGPNKIVTRKASQYKMQPLGMNSAYAGLPPNDYRDSVTIGFECNIAQLVMGLAAYMLSVQTLDIAYVMSQAELYGKISLAIFNYIAIKAKLQIAEERVSSSRLHVKNSRARFDSGVINELGLRQADQNLTLANYKRSACVIELKSVEAELRQYWPDVDLKKLDDFSYDVSTVNFSEYSEKDMDQLLTVKKARMLAKQTRAKSAMNALSCVSPTIFVKATNIHNTAEKEPGTIEVGLKFDLSPKTIISFSNAAAANKEGILKFVQSRRELQTALRNATSEFNMHKELVKIQTQVCNVRASVLKLVKQKEFRGDTEKHYNDILKYEDDLYKSRIELVDANMQMTKSFLKILELTDMLVPANSLELSNRVSEATKKDKSINREYLQCVTRGG